MTPDDPKTSYPNNFLISLLKDKMHKAFFKYELCRGSAYDGIT